MPTYEWSDPNSTEDTKQRTIVASETVTQEHKFTLAQKEKELQKVTDRKTALENEIAEVKDALGIS